MATLVEAVGALQQFGVYNTIFPFLLITAALYAIFLKYKPFGENKAVNIIVASVIGLIFISFARAVAFLNLLLPIITLMLILIVLAVLIFAFIGIKTESMAGAVAKYPIVIILLFIIVIIAVLVQVFPEASLVIQSPAAAEQLNISPTGAPPGATPQQQAGALMLLQAMRVITSPQIFGLIILFLVFGLAIYFITREPVK